MAYGDFKDLIYFYFIYLRIFTQAVFTSYLCSEINDSPIRKCKHIYTLQQKYIYCYQCASFMLKIKLVKVKLVKF